MVEAPASDLVRVRDGRGLSTEMLRSAGAASFERMARARSPPLISFLPQPLRRNGVAD